jgi:7-cyano-7-deazaguanine synthase
VKSALLLSGGMDSIALAWWCRPDLAITIDYGQRPATAEITAAAQVCREIDIPHVVLHIDASSLGSGDLAGNDALPYAPASDWWPFRNQLLITLAGACALKHGCSRLIIGTVSTDATHLDGTARFVEHINALMAYQEGALTVEAPALHLNTADLVRESGVPARLMAWAHSCHKANSPCSDCRGCYKHYEVLQALGGGLHALP